jgi:hypothetical protein
MCSAMLPPQHWPQHQGESVKKRSRDAASRDDPTSRGREQQGAASQRIGESRQTGTPRQRGIYPRILGQPIANFIGGVYRSSKAPHPTETPQSTEVANLISGVYRSPEAPHPTETPQSTEVANLISGVYRSPEAPHPTETPQSTEAPQSTGPQHAPLSSSASATSARSEKQIQADVIGKKVGSTGARSTQSLSSGHMGMVRTVTHKGEATAQLIAEDVRGLQIGEHNLQLNSYRYEIKPAPINFREVFDKPPVRLALQRLAQNPANKHLKHAADRALRGEQPRRLDWALRGISRIKQTTSAAAVKLVSHESRSSTRGIFSLFFVSNSSGVDVGDNMRQENYFHYVVTANVEAANLLASDPDLRSVIIARAQSNASGDTSDRKLIPAMEESLRRASLAAQSDLDRGATVRPPQSEQTTYVEHLDGVTVGWDVDRKSSIRTAVQVPRLRQFKLEMKLALDSALKNPGEDESDIKPRAQRGFSPDSSPETVSRLTEGEHRQVAGAPIASERTVHRFEDGDELKLSPEEDQRRQATKQTERTTVKVDTSRSVMKQASNAAQTSREHADFAERMRTLEKLEEEQIALQSDKQEHQETDQPEEAEPFIVEPHKPNGDIAAGWPKAPSLNITKTVAEDARNVDRCREPDVGRSKGMSR